MVIKTLTNIEKDALKEVGYIGAGHATKALSEMIGQAIDVEVPLAATISLRKLPETVGGKEKLVTGIYLPITGDVKGSVLVIFPQRSALNLADLLMKRRPGTTKSLTEVDKSALKEAGNILSGNCLTALSKFLDMRLIEHIPDLASDMIGAIMDTIIIKFGQNMERALVLEMTFKTKSKVKIQGYFFLLFNIKEAGRILKAIKKKVAI